MQEETKFVREFILGSAGEELVKVNKEVFDSLVILLTKQKTVDPYNVVTKMHEQLSVLIHKYKKSTELTTQQKDNILFARYVDMIERECLMFKINMYKNELLMENHVGKEETVKNTYKGESSDMPAEVVA